MHMDKYLMNYIDMKMLACMYAHGYSYLTICMHTPCNMTCMCADTDHACMHTHTILMETCTHTCMHTCMMHPSVCMHDASIAYIHA